MKKMYEENVLKEIEKGILNAQYDQVAKKFKNMRIIYLTNEENCCKIIVRIILLGGINKWQVKQLL